MPRLDDFLEPLHQGVLELPLPKEAVTEPLDPGWEKSSINIPAPGMVASYRKGQYHVHETATEWKVHLDRYDPKEHPVMHLVDDAPFIQMITDTVLALLMITRESGDTRQILSAQEKAWQLEILLGSVSILAGLLIASDPRWAFRSLFGLLIPALILLLGLVMVTRGFRSRAEGGTSWGPVFSGLGTCLIGIIALVLPERYWALAILAILAIWGFASAAVAIVAVKRGESLGPETLGKRLALGIVSLALSLLIFIEPFGVVWILTEVLGIVALVLGITLLVNGVRIRRRMRSSRNS
ncbi:MAG: DUF308 domain-containing protein [Methanomicrobiales archaeon]|nr:DUF308 domain-containing protein [Methanomicrobiales archaeon]